MARLYELDVDIDTRESAYFRRDRLDLHGTFYSPSGRTRTVYGYLHALEASPAGRPRWRIRFTPDEPGRWWFAVTVRDRHGEVTSPILPFECRASDRTGFVRVAREDARFFELSNGEFFYPVGMNAAWATNMDYYFERLARQGANTVRVWMCPWHLPLERREKPGQYDLGVARRLDQILHQAEARGLRVILVLEYHGMLKDSWDENPYNTANGGPCAAAHEVFTNDAARELFKRRLDYMTARWGYSTALFAWELWNEVDYGAWRRFDDVVDWHKIMAEHVKKVDSHDHPVTTSAGTLDRLKPLAALGGIDFASCHLYTADMASETQRADEMLTELPRKPILLAEFGAHPEGNAVGPQASRIQFTSGLWLSATMPWAGAGLSWWWDTRVDRDNLYPALGGLARLTAAADRRLQPFHRVQEVIPAGADLKAHVRGLLSPSQGLFYVYDPARLEDIPLADRPLLAEGSGFTLEGLLAGAFHVEILDARTGRVIRKGRRRCTDGTLYITLPAARTELAVQVRHATGSLPAFRPGSTTTK